MVGNRHGVKYIEMYLIINSLENISNTFSNTSFSGCITISKSSLQAYLVFYSYDDRQTSDGGIVIANYITVKTDSKTIHRDIYLFIKVIQKIHNKMPMLLFWSVLIFI